MTEPGQPRNSREGTKLYTLTEVAQKVGISMPTAQRYKKRYADRIPSQGKGRTQRYPEEAIAAFAAIRKESDRKRGRPAKRGRKGAVKKAAKKRAPRKKAAGAKPRKSAGARAGAGRGGSRRARRGRRAVAGRAGGRGAGRRGGKRAAGRGGRELLPLSEIRERTGISYPTLSRYVRLYLDRIPHEGTGRRRRYPPEAVPVFKQLRGESRRGRKKGQAAAGAPGAARRGVARDRMLARRIEEIEKAQKSIEQQLRAVVRTLRKPLRVTIRSD